MDIQAHPDNTGYAPKSCQWHAIDMDTYDGAEDTLPPSSVGYGSTEKEAILDLLEIMLDEGEITNDEMRELLVLHSINVRDVGFGG